MDSSILDTLAPEEALLRVTRQILREFPMWQMATEPKATRHKMVNRRFVRECVDRLNTIGRDYTARAPAILPKLRQVHSPRLVSVGSVTGTCYTEIAWSLMASLRSALPDYHRPPDFEAFVSVPPDMVIKQWRAVRILVRNAVMGFSYEPLDAGVRQEFFAAFPDTYQRAAETRGRRKTRETEFDKLYSRFAKDPKLFNSDVARFSEEEHSKDSKNRRQRGKKPRTLQYYMRELKAAESRFLRKNKGS